MYERNCTPRSWLDFIADDEDELPGIDDDMDEEVEVEFDDGMDGDHASALASAGWGTDEDYGLFFDGSEYADDGEY